jgi:Flp pilus assembly pilin Flp
MSAVTSTGRQTVPSLVKRIGDDERGTTAVEFAIISVPFITLLLGIISVCLYYFTVLEAENAVTQASRDMRTGAYQLKLAGTGYAGKSGDALKNAFVKAICDRTRDTATCQSKVRVQVVKYASFDGVAGITKPSCKDGSGNLISGADALANFDPGGASEIVYVTMCYAWKFGGELPFFKIGNMPDGSFLVRASAVMRTEPFN